MKTKAELIQSWLDKAEKDILTVEHELSFANAVTESICFHSQQAVEKFLKAYLIFLDISFPRTHEIGELITRCAERDPDIARWRDEADELTDYAVEVRYPDNLLEPSIEEARAAS